MYVLTSMVTS